MKLRISNFSTMVAGIGCANDSVIAIRTSFPDVSQLVTDRNCYYAERNNNNMCWSLEYCTDYVQIYR